MTWGDRYEGGWSYGGRGVRLSYFQVGAQEQSFGTVNGGYVLVRLGLAEQPAEL